MCNCNGTGVVVAELMPGAVLVQPCGCAAAGRNRERAERELRELLEAIQHEKAENALAGLAQNCAGCWL